MALSSTAQGVFRCWAKSGKPRSMIQAMADLADSKVTEMTESGIDKYQAEKLVLDYMVEADKQRTLVGAIRDMYDHRKEVDIMDNYRAAVAQGGFKGYAWVLAKLVRNDRDFTNATEVSVDGLARSISQQATAKINIALQDMSQDIGLFMSNETGEKRFMRALYNTPEEGDELSVLAAAAFKDGMDFLYDQATRAGLVMPYRKDFHLWINHDMDKVARTDKDKWKQDMLRLGDWQNMRGNNGEVLSGDKIKEILDGMYDHVKNGHRIVIIPEDGTVIDSKMGKHQMGRFLKFKDADSHFEYHKTYGLGNLVGHIVHNLDNLSTDIALASHFGTEPQRVFQNLLTQMKNDKTLSDGELSRIQALWFDLVGESNRVQIGALNTLHRVSINLAIASQLGSAAIAALQDIVPSAMTALFHGRSPFAVWHQQARAMALQMDREQLKALGFASSHTVRGIIQASRRFYDGGTGVGATGLISENAMRISGLNHWTGAMQEGAYVFNMTTLNGWVDKGFENLSRRQREFLGQYGLNEVNFAWLAKAPKMLVNGVKVINIDKIPFPEGAEGDFGMAELQRLRNNIVAMGLDETSRAVPTVSARSRAITRGQTRAGTLGGVAIRQATFLWQFLTENFFAHMHRGYYQGNGITGKVGYLGSFMVLSTAMAAFTMDIYEIVRGRQPANNKTADYWWAAFVRGGSMSHLGDVIGSIKNSGQWTKFGDLFGPLGKVGGAGIEMSTDLFNLNTTADKKGKQIANTAIDTGREFLPYNNTWYLRWLIDYAFHNFQAEYTDKRAPGKGPLNNRPWLPLDNSPAQPIKRSESKPRGSR